jgi:nucleotide-binding universal stress UspA family protein
MPQRVLVPYDTSTQAEYALEHAVTAFDDADIVLLHVIEPFVDHTSAYNASNYRQQFETAETMLDDVCEEYEDAARIETRVQYGRPIHGIVSTLTEDRFDHVVIGSHGRDGASRLLLGSVAETVARRSPVPVTVVRTLPKTDDPQTVLVPFDASAMSKRALEYALDQFPDASVTALYVTYPTENGLAAPNSEFDAFEDWSEQRTDHTESILSTAKEVADERTRAIETEHIDGTPADAIVEFTEDESFEHVVVGSTGRDGLARLLLGSVAETVIRRSPVSVTVVK